MKKLTNKKMKRLTKIVAVLAVSIPIGVGTIINQIRNDEILDVISLGWLIDPPRGVLEYRIDFEGVSLQEYFQSIRECYEYPEKSLSYNPITGKMKIRIREGLEKQEESREKYPQI